MEHSKPSLNIQNVTEMGKTKRLNRKFAESWDISELKQLLDAGADINTYYNGNTKLASAAYRNNMEVAEFLIQRGAKINDCNSCEALSNAVYNRHRDMTEMLLKNGADVACYDEEDLTPLMIAADKKDYDIVKLLLDYGADVNQKDRQGSTALIFAIDNLKIVKLLVSRGAKVNGGNIFWEDMLVLTIEFKMYEMLEYLLSCKFSKRRKQNALHIAIKTGRKECADILMRNGVRVSVKVLKESIDINDYKIIDYLSSYEES